MKNIKSFIQDKISKIKNLLKQIKLNYKKIPIFVLNAIKNFIIKYKHILIEIITFLIFDRVLRYNTRSIGFYNINKECPNLFTIAYIILFIGISNSFKKNFSRFLYILFYIISLLLFITHSIYYSYFSNFFDFSQLSLAGEGASYIIDALKASPIWLIIASIFTIILSFFTCKFIPERKKNFNYILFTISIILFISIHYYAPTTLGKTTTEWDAWRKPRNVYNSFNDNKRSMQVAGFYEYNFRNLYVNFLKKEIQVNDEENELLKEKFNKENKEYKNEYTGLFKDKNVIFIQLESVDKFLVTKEIMPTLYGLQKNSINFKNHYSFVSGAGSTFNSEYMINTGYTTPISSNKSAYTFSKNTYTYSLANMLKKDGYTVNAFHMNTAEYYSRDVNYKSFGYDSFNSLKSMDNGKYYSDNTYWLDTELINNEVFNKKIFNTEEKFANYIITYSAHMPFNQKGVCGLLTDKASELDEFDCLKIQAKETDDMIKLLINNLEETGLIDNTILVLFADHYLYTLEDKTILDKYKTTENNLINNTTWMVWSKDMKKKDIKEVTSQLNILPTMLNLLGLEYHPNYYLMPDALSKNYKGFVFFKDYSWYDGNVYVDNGIITNGKKADEKYILEMNNKVNKLAKINDTVLITDYFKHLKKEQMTE